MSNQEHKAETISPTLEQWLDDPYSPNLPLDNEGKLEIRQAAEDIKIVAEMGDPDLLDQYVFSIYECGLGVGYESARRTSFPDPGPASISAPGLKAKTITLDGRPLTGGDLESGEAVTIDRVTGAVIKRERQQSKKSD